VNVVDSSGWLEYLGDGPDAAFFAQTLQEVDELLVPTLTIQEVVRAIFDTGGEGDALQTAAAMQQGLVVELDTTLALEAGRISMLQAVGRESSVVLATARRFGAEVWTLSSELRDVRGVRYRARADLW
jgi:predicted nucleic acid-binding protein